MLSVSHGLFRRIGFRVRNRGLLIDRLLNRLRALVENFNQFVKCFPGGSLEVGSSSSFAFESKVLTAITSLAVTWRAENQGLAGAESACRQIRPHMFPRDGAHCKWLPLEGSMVRNLYYFIVPAALLTLQVTHSAMEPNDQNRCAVQSANQLLPRQDRTNRRDNEING